ncbi:hypothetical protein Tco_1098434 [Tanacetum coccineum]
MWCCYDDDDDELMMMMVMTAETAGGGGGKMARGGEWGSGLGDSGVAVSSPFLKEEVMSLKGLELIAEQEKPVVNQGPVEPTAASTAPPPVQERKPATDKKMAKPKWLKM